MIATETLSAWIQSVQGKYINADGAYGAQCWDLSAHWAQWIGKPIINTGGAGRWPGWAGNMVDAFPQTPEIAAAYDLITPDQKGESGDHVIWGDSYWYYPATHVAVLIADKGAQLQCMSQNSTPSRADNPYPGQSSGPTTIQSLPRQGLIGFIRPRNGINPQGTITPSKEDDMATVPQEEWNAVRDAAYRINGVITDPNAKVLTTNDIAGIVTSILDVPIARGGSGAGIGNGLTSLRSMVSWNDDGTIQLLAAAAASAAQDGSSVEDIKAAVIDALRENVIKVDVTVAGAK